MLMGKSKIGNVGLLALEEAINSNTLFYSDKYSNQTWYFSPDLTYSKILAKPTKTTDWVNTLKYSDWETPIVSSVWVSIASAKYFYGNV